MEVLGVIAFIVLGYIIYKDYKKDKQDKSRMQEEAQRRWKEAQEAAARLNFEQELERKAAQWSNSPFFLKLADYASIWISNQVKSELGIKIGRNDKDIRTIFCKHDCIETGPSYVGTGLVRYDSKKCYNYSELGFDVLRDDSTNTTIASLNLALLRYLQKRFQALPEVSFSLSGEALGKCFLVDSRDGHLSWFDLYFAIKCDMTKVHPLLEEITLP